MTEALTLRALAVLDLDQAAMLHREAFASLGERGWTRQELAELVASPGVAGLLLQGDGKEIGFALSRTAADEAELLTIAVAVSHRRRGAGKALLEGVIATVGERGARHLFLEVGEDNSAALALYRQKGFEPAGRRAAYYTRPDGRRADALVMRLNLNYGG